MNNDPFNNTPLDGIKELFRLMSKWDPRIWGGLTAALVVGIAAGSAVTTATTPPQPRVPLQCPAPRQPSCDGIRRLLENESRMCHEDLSSCRARATSCEDRLNAEPVEEHVFPRRGQH